MKEKSNQMTIRKQSNGYFRRVIKTRKKEKS